LASPPDVLVESNTWNDKTWELKQPEGFNPQEARSIIKLDPMVEVVRVYSRNRAEFKYGIFVCLRLVRDRNRDEAVEYERYLSGDVTDPRD